MEGGDRADERTALGEPPADAAAPGVESAERDRNGTGVDAGPSPAWLATPAEPADTAGTFAFDPAAGSVASGPVGTRDAAVADPIRPVDPATWPELRPADPETWPALRPDGAAPAAGSSAGSSNPAEVAPRRTHRWGLGAYLFVELIFLLASAAVGVLVVGGAPAQAGALAVALAVPTLIAAGLALLITRVRGNGPRADLRLQLVVVGRAARAGLRARRAVRHAARIDALHVDRRGRTPRPRSARCSVRSRPPGGWALLIFAIVVFVAPLCEEIVYRGLLWGAVERLQPGRWVPLVVTTLLFALAHFEFTRTPLLLVVGIPIALARLYTGRLLASIVAHQVNNLLPGVALMLGLVGVIPMS